MEGLQIPPDAQEPINRCDGRKLPRKKQILEDIACPDSDVDQSPPTPGKEERPSNMDPERQPRKKKDEEAQAQLGRATDDVTFSPRKNWQITRKKTNLSLELTGLNAIHSQKKEPGVHGRVATI